MKLNRIISMLFAALLCLSICCAEQETDSLPQSGVSLLSTGYTQYNCYSYAWLKDLYPSLYQHVKLGVSEVSCFRSDSYYSV